MAIAPITAAPLSIYDAQTAMLDWLASLGHAVDYSDDTGATIMRASTQLTPDEVVELTHLYNTAQVTLDTPTRYDRLIYAARAFAHTHNDVPVNSAYIAVDRHTRSP